MLDTRPDSKAAPFPQPLDEMHLFRQLVDSGIDNPPINLLMEQMSHGLVSLGLPLFRVNTSHLTIHPELVGFDHEWWRDKHVSVASAWSRDDDSPAYEDGREVYPFVYMMEENLVRMHVSLVDEADFGNYPAFPLFDVLRQRGVTDYYSVAVDLHASGENNRLGRYFIAFCADGKGFSGADIAMIDRILPAYSLAAKSRTHESVVHNLLDAYLGREAGRRVLDGQIALGDTVNIKSVICFADLRASTRWAEELDEADFVAVLNDYFGAVAGAIYENGGEVLRYIGDGILAIFPYDEMEVATNACQASRCDAALSAALVARERMDAVNDRRHARGLKPLDFGMALHVGDVTYGNIGINQRLDFTVIGPAANAAARLESLCREEGQNLLVSRQFAEGSMPPPGGWKSLGPRRLKGVEAPVEVMTLAEPKRLTMPVMPPSIRA